MQCFFFQTVSVRTTHIETKRGDTKGVIRSDINRWFCFVIESMNQSILYVVNILWYLHWIFHQVTEAISAAGRR